MAGTQFIGKEPILAVYRDEFDEHPWVLWQGRKKRAAGQDAAELENWIDRFAPAGSTATYTLNVYPEGMNPEEVNYNTDELASWDFKINAYQTERGTAGGAIGRVQQLIEGEIVKKMEKMEELLREEREERESVIDINKIIMDYLENPHKLAAIGGFLKSILGGGQAVGASAPAAIGSVPPTTPPGSGGISESDMQRLAAALDRLHAKYPNLVTALEKLADLADNDPLTWSVIKSKLDAL